MRFRRISCRYAEIVGEVPRAFAAEIWDVVRPRGLASPFFRPAADVVETRDAYVVTVELPGVDDDEMDLYVHPDALVVAGRRRCPGVPGARWHAAEIRYGPFRFDVPLPGDVDPESVDATTDRGLLRITFRKRAP
jgi:HSP20 family protein